MLIRHDRDDSTSDRLAASLGEAEPPEGQGGPSGACLEAALFGLAAVFGGIATIGALLYLVLGPRNGRRPPRSRKGRPRRGRKAWFER